MLQDLDVADAGRVCLRGTDAIATLLLDNDVLLVDQVLVDVLQGAEGTLLSLSVPARHLLLILLIICLQVEVGGDLCLAVNMLIWVWCLEQAGRREFSGRILPAKGLEVLQVQLAYVDSAHSH